VPTIQLGKRRVSLLALLIAAFLLVGQHYGWFDRLNNYVEISQPGQYQVTRFIDGDTIMVSMNGRDETIRFIGVDTPETHKPNTPVQCYGPAAAAFTKTPLATSGSGYRSIPTVPTATATTACCVTSTCQMAPL
jgi:endonuclease YncB( thermonuclease family)